MPESEQLPSIDIRDWKGLVQNADPLDIPPGALVRADNCAPQSQGEITTRKGLRPVTFDD